MASFLGGATSDVRRSTHDRPDDPDRPSAPSAPASGAPAALRGHRPGWRDPRLWVGVVIVAASVLAGVRVLAHADDTVQVWAAGSDLGPGQSLQEADLVAERVHFADAAQSGAYFRVDQTLPGDVRLTRPVGSGELIARTAVGAASASGLLEVPIAVDPEQVPPSVHDGAVVDVYVVAPGAASTGAAGTGAAGGAQGAEPALAEATVVDAPSVSSSFGTTGKRQLVLAVPEDQARAFFATLTRYDDPVLTVVRRA